MKNFFNLILASSLVLSASVFMGCNEEKKEERKPVSVLIYSDYMDPSMLKDFEATYGYPLQLELYEAQEEMIGKLQASGTAMYDVIIASDVVIQQMIHLNLLQKLDLTKIENRKNLDPKFLNPDYDPNNEYTVPYLWGTSGIVYSDTTIAPEDVSYAMLFDSTKTTCNFSLLDESRSMLSMTLQSLGLNPNTKDKEEIKKAVDVLLQAKSNPKFIGFDGSVAGKDKMISGAVQMAVVFNGEAQMAISENPKLRYAIPKEGSFIWVDVMTLSSKSPNPEGAYAFMNYILDAKNGAKLANYVAFGSPNKESYPFLDPEMASNPVIYPDSTIMNRLVFLSDPGEAARFYDEAWTILKSR
ncbi:MAG: spermidine/putrescine ABC transporter substrate-binding protein [Fibrobacteraceae bacterium]|jgi:spermidine/putrescine transport system substrate-binding protein|nr:spermidine/putrescine ABC transporter substrate-binding protein [Fibrobacteraceae bacterium]